MKATLVEAGEGSERIVATRMLSRNALWLMYPLSSRPNVYGRFPLEIDWFPASHTTRRQRGGLACLRSWLPIANNACSEPLFHDPRRPGKKTEIVA